ncbi:MAG TPA: Type 1 glutamine amidotransferase-like domain-containing protein, partial [Tepidiformaceae bacterium]|nr:Type 1 glutamine amidotransferase-like domain-containing protein [Tepidiformaceae bacterium]
MLLTSAGVKNASIRDALTVLLGKPIAECNALIVPTAVHAMPNGPAAAWRTVSGNSGTPLAELGWKSGGVLELTALPSIAREHWVAAVHDADALLVAGGDPLYLSYWMTQSGLAEILPTLDDTVYVGVSAGSMVMAPRIGADFVVWKPPAGRDETLGFVDFSIFPHLDHPALPENTMVDAERWAADLAAPCYAIDDDTAIQVTDAGI